MKIGELFVQIGVAADTFKVKDFSRAIGEMPIVIAGALTAVATLALAYGKLMDQVMGTSAALQIFSAKTGVSEEDLQRWQHVAQGVGVSQEAITSSMLGLSKTLADAQLGKLNGQAWMMLGVNPMGKTIPQVLKELMDNHGRQSPGMEANALSAIGVNPDIMRIFGMDKDKFAQRYNDPVALTKAEMKSFDELRDHLVQLGLIIALELNPALEASVPLMEKFIHMFSWWVKLMADIVRVNVRGISGLWNAKNDLKGLFEIPKNAYGSQTLEYNSGDIIYNVWGESPEENIGRKINEANMKKEMFNLRQANAFFNGQGY